MAGMRNDLAVDLSSVVGTDHMLAGVDALDYRKDEALGAAAGEPAFVVLP